MSHMFTASDMKTLVVLVFFGRIGPPCVSQVVIKGKEAPQHQQTAQRRPSQEGGDRDLVAARLPYAILTKMVAFSGWKRFEMNETLKFHWVTEMTFPSTVRRSLIINKKGRFVSAQSLASLFHLSGRFVSAQSPGHPGVLSHARRRERFRDLTACGGCLVHCRPR